MRVRLMRLGLVLGAAGWLGLASAAAAAPSIPSKKVLGVGIATETAASRAAPVKGLAPIRSLARKPSPSPQRAHKAKEKAIIASKDRLTSSLGPIDRKAHPKDHQAGLDKGVNRGQLMQPIDPQTHYKREVGVWPRHHAKTQGKIDWNDHFRRKHAGKDESDKKPLVTYLGSIDHDKRHDHGHHKKHGRYFFGGAVYIDYRSEPEIIDDNDRAETKTAEDDGERDCEKGRDCDVKLKWIRVPAKVEQETPLK